MWVQSGPATQLDTVGDLDGRGQLPRVHRDRVQVRPGHDLGVDERAVVKFPPDLGQRVFTLRG